MRYFTSAVSAALLSIMLVSAADAAPPPWAHARGWHDNYRPQNYHGYDRYYGYGYAPPLVIVEPAPVIAAPPPVVFEEDLPVFQNESGQYCREYQTQVTVAGRQHSSYGTACQQPDGQWQVVN